ncbi:MAG: hypothetical protein JWR60_84 [Polaromonas sp.]|nr:hypothetical protein [Polaromonas sp.]
MDIDQPLPASADHLIRQIAALAPAGLPASPTVVEQLRVITQQLIDTFKADGKLDHSPMALAMNRTVDLHREAAQMRLKGARVLITGGAGCVGSALIPLLLELGARDIVIVDIAEDAGSGAAPGEPAGAGNTAVFRVDIRDVEGLDAVFSRVRPQVVFHLASIREPGRAEAVVREAIETNVFGTRNVIQACLRHGVEDAIYSSTGKCFAYVTDHVYTGSKKLAEAQWVAAARRSPSTRFRCTRFTHVLENGVVTHDIMSGIASGLVGLHGPDRYFNIQNLRQATHLLVNALALARQTPADGFWSAVDLGWPVNTLELALYNIQRSGQPVALYFLGVPKGYDEAFFRGQFCWDGETPYHPLLNALEAHASFEDSSGTMVGARVQPFSEAALAAELDRLESALSDAMGDVGDVKNALIEAVAGLAGAIFGAADMERLIDVLWWGSAPVCAGANASEARRFKLVIRLLTDAVLAGLAHLHGALPAQSRKKLLDVAQTLAQVDSLSVQAHKLSALLAKQGQLRLMSLPRDMAIQTEAQHS